MVCSTDVLIVNLSRHYRIVAGAHFWSFLIYALPQQLGMLASPRIVTHGIDRCRCVFSHDKMCNFGRVVLGTNSKSPTSQRRLFQPHLGWDGFVLDLLAALGQENYEPTKNFGFFVTSPKFVRLFPGLNLYQEMEVGVTIPKMRGVWRFWWLLHGRSWCYILPTGG